MTKQEFTSSIRFFKSHWEPSCSHAVLFNFTFIATNKNPCTCAWNIVFFLWCDENSTEIPSSTCLCKEFVLFPFWWVPVVPLSTYCPIYLHLTLTLCQQPKTTSHNLWLHCLCPLQHGTVQCGDSLLYGREQHRFWWNTGTLVKTLTVPQTLTAPPWRFAALKYSALRNKGDCSYLSWSNLDISTSCCQGLTLLCCLAHFFIWVQLSSSTACMIISSLCSSPAFGNFPKVSHLCPVVSLPSCVYKPGRPSAWCQFVWLS